jgi:transposase-like protein/tetratricopeptide (TPR) repeat protein
MKSYTAAKLPFEKRVEIVKAYLEKRGSLRKIAHSYGISYMTLWQWVKQYRKGGKENIRRKISYKTSNRRFSKEIEKKIMLLKEHEPGLTTKKTARILKGQSLHISHNGVWMIWKRYGLVNRPKDEPLSLVCPDSPELENGMQQAQRLIEKGELEKAAILLNELSALTDMSILKDIPEKFLSLRRRLERLHLLYNTIPRTEIYNKAAEIRKNMEIKGYLFSSVFAGLLEVFALQWMREPEKQLKILKIISKRMAKVRDTSLRFTLHFLLSMTHSELLQVKEGLKHLDKCRRFLASLPYPFYWMTLGDILTFATRYKESIFYYKKVIDAMDIGQTTKQLLCKKIAMSYGMTGQYQQSLKFLNRVIPIGPEETYSSRFYQIKANISFAQGYLEEANHFYEKSFEQAKSTNFRNILFSASIGLAQVSRALGKQHEAQAFLKRCLPLMKKYRMRHEMQILRALINRTTIPKSLYEFPTYRLCHLLCKAAENLRTRYYYEALNFAKKKGFLGIFHRYIVFFPEPILHLLEKGKPTGLPGAILRFPIFNQRKPVYHIRLLGNIIVYKNQQYAKAKLTPKEKALLIHLTLKAGEPGKSILSVDLYRNFWPDSKNPSNLLSHLLVTLKKKLRLPSHLLMVSSKLGESRLVNCGVHLTTDYNDLEIAFVQANALERAGEWAFAKREYLRAFRLFHGEPFKKIYDNWSEHMRRVILNKLETEGKHFARSCLEHGNKKDVKKVLEKVAQIIPGSEEIRKMASSFG